MDSRLVPKDNVSMAPVKKPAQRLRRTFLREWREYRDLTQETAASRIGVSRTLLSKIESAKSPYLQNFLERAAEAYMCEPWDLLNVNPLKEGDVVDLTSMMKRASPEDAAAIIGFARGRLTRT